MLRTLDPLSNPLNCGLLGWWRCWPGLTGGAGVCDIVGWNDAALNGPRGDFWMANGKVEFGRLCWAAVAGSTVRFDLTATRRYQNLPAFTIAVTVYGRGGPTGGDATTGFFGAWDGVHSLNQVLMRVSGGIQCFIRNAANTAQAAPTVTSPSTNEWHRYVIRGDGSTLHLSYDGLAATGTAALTGPYIPTGSETWSFGCARGSQEFTRSSDLKVWGRYLTDPEVVADWHDTEQLEPPSAYRRGRFFGPAPTGGATPITATDSLGLSDSGSITAALSAAASDSLGLSDVATVTLASAISATDSLGLSDVGTVTLTLAVAASDTLALSDVGTATLPPGIAISATDSLGLSDTGGAILTLALAATDSLDLSDSASLALAATLTASDTLALSDVGLASTGVLPILIVGTDTLALTDSSSQNMTAVIAETDSLTLTDLGSVTAAMAVAASDTLTLTDLATGSTLAPGSIAFVDITLAPVTNVTVTTTTVTRLSLVLTPD